MARSTRSGRVPSMCSVTSSTNSRQATVTTSSPGDRGPGTSATGLSFLRGSAVHVLQPGAQPRPAPVQQDPLVTRADPQPRADLLGRQPVDVAQFDHGPLTLGQLVESGPQFTPGLRGDGRVLRRWLPGRRPAGRRPATRPAISGTAEPGRVDGGTTAVARVVGERRRPRDGPRLADPP